MDFIGTGRRLAQGDVGDAARWLGVTTPVLLAFMEIEAAGRGFDARRRPKMLFEPHVFWRELGAGQGRDRAAAQGLAYAKWQPGKYPTESYPRLIAARAIHPTASLRSASWGLGQILADKFAFCGFASEIALVTAMMQGEREQLWAMVTLMRAWKMVPMLTGRDFDKAASWEDAARKWNGKGYATHNYHGRMAAAHAKHSKGEAMTHPDGAATVLRRGMKGEAVRGLQADLVSLGIELVVDGRFGLATEAAVRQFQRAGQISADGVVGAQTRVAIGHALAALDAKGEDNAPPPPVWPGQEEVAAPAPKPQPAPPPDWDSSKSAPLPAADGARLPRPVAILIGLAVAAIAAVAIIIQGGVL